MSRPPLYSNEKILKAAAELFLRDGLKAATPQIARRAGVSEGVLFKRFKTKRALFEAAMELDFDQSPWRENLLSQVGKNTPQKNLTKALLELLAKLEVVIPRMMVLQGAGPIPGETLRDVPPVRDARVLCDYLEAEAKLHGWRIKYTAISAHQMIGAVVHYVMIFQLNGFTPSSKEEYISHLVLIHLAALSKQ